MAKEASITVNLNIRKASADGTVLRINYGRSASFQIDVDGAKGPSPGAFTCTPQGVVVDLSALVEPGLVWLTNLESDPANYVEYGPYDPVTGRFYPTFKLRPGTSWPAEFAADLPYMEYGTGSGTGTSSQSFQLMFRSKLANAVVSVEAFEA